MSVTIEAVVRNGVLEPRTPIALPEGTEVQLFVVDSRDPSETSRSHEDEMKFWDEWFSEPSPVSDEEWKAFDQFLRENRFNIEERLDFPSGLERGVGSTPAPSRDSQKGLPGA